MTLRIWGDDFAGLTNTVMRVGMLFAFTTLLTLGAMVAMGKGSSQVRADHQDATIELEAFGYNALDPADFYELGREDAEALAGTGFSDSFTVACGTTATEISANGQHSYMCQSYGTTHVYVGDSAVSGDAGTRFCDGCPSQQFGGNVYKEYCRIAGLADSGVTANVHCRAQVMQEP